MWNSQRDPMRRLVIAALVLVVTVGGYYLAAVRPPAPAPAVVVESAARQDRAASAESSGVASAAPATPDPAPASSDERPAFIKQAMRKSMDGLRGQYVEELVARGLARLDSERIVDEFAAGIVDCLFDVASKDYEAHGYTLDEFLHG